MAANAFTVNSVVSGGRGGRVFCRASPVSPEIPWGQQSPNEAFEITGFRIDHPPSRVASEAQLGGYWIFEHIRHGFGRPLYAVLQL